MSRLSFIAILSLLALTINLGACSDDSCYGNGSSLPLATLHIGEKQQTVTGLSIMGIGVPGDSLLVDSSSINEVYLPLRASVSSTSYALWRWVTTDNVRTMLRDTITFDYEPVEYFHSIECGAMFNFDINTVSTTHHGIDSVVLLTPHVTNSRTPALRIHFSQSAL